MRSRDQEKIKVCYIAGREYAYTRTRTVVLALKEAKIDFRLCLPPNKKFRHYFKLILEFIWKKRGCDAVIIGFYGALLLPVIRILTRKPIIFDIHSGTHETMLDWERIKPGSLVSKIYYYVDHFTMNWADIIILESEDHIRNWSKTYKVPQSKFRHIFLAVDNNVLFPRESGRDKRDVYLVHFHGEFAPFHGVRHILTAASLLKDKNVEFKIIGFGTTYEKDMELVRELSITNCIFIKWVPYEKLAEYMCRADVCLGFFGDRKRAYEVFTNKVVEAIAVRKPLITMRNKPVQELLTDGKSVIMVEPGDPEALADAIEKLKNNPELSFKIAENGYQTCLEKCTIEVFGRQLKQIIKETVSERY